MSGSAPARNGEPIFEPFIDNGTADGAAPELRRFDDGNGAVAVFISSNTVEINHRMKNFHKKI